MKKTVQIRRVIPAPREPEKEKRYFHSDGTRHGLAFYRNNEFVFDELYQEPRIVISLTERAKTNHPKSNTRKKREEVPENVEVIKTRQRRNPLPNPGTRQLSQDYITDGMSVYALTQKYNRSTDTIKAWLQLAGIMRGGSKV